jgi:tetratricopeptide (TPR) repeat protein
MNTADTYLIKALDHYPWDLEETMEALGYGLAYNAEHPALLCLMGRVCADQLHQYTNAIGYYEDALSADLDYPETYYHYLNILVKMGQLDKAEKLSEQALKVAGIDKYTIYGWKSAMHEQREQYQEAIDMIDRCRKHCYNKPASDFLDEEITRINKKLNPGKKEDDEDRPRKKTFFEKMGYTKNEK